jgi:hypothetical protein
MDNRIYFIRSVRLLVCVISALLFNACIRQSNVNYKYNLKSNLGINVIDKSPNNCSNYINTWEKNLYKGWIDSGLCEKDKILKGISNTLLTCEKDEKLYTLGNHYPCRGESRPTWARIGYNGDINYTASLFYHEYGHIIIVACGLACNLKCEHELIKKVKPFIAKYGQYNGY